MQKKFLEELGLEKEKIDKIMSEHEKDVEKSKKEIATLSEKTSNLEVELEQYKTTSEEANAEIEKYKSMDLEGIQRSAEEWKQKYESFQSESKKQKKELEQQMQRKEYELSAREFLNQDQYRFSSEFAKKAFLNDFIAKGLKLEEGKFLGAEDYIKQFKESNPGVFQEVETQKKDPKTDHSFYEYKPQGGEAEADLSNIVAAAIQGSI